MSLWKRLKALWRISGLWIEDSDNLKKTIEKIIWKSKQAKIIEPTLLEEIDKNV